jgi:Protein of unknown function (DUF2442)
MFKPIEVRALPGYKIHVRYADGVSGEVDLSHLVGKGVFSLWSDPRQFARVHIGPAGAIVWNEDVDLCPDSLYLQVTGKKPEDVFPSLALKEVDA